MLNHVFSAFDELAEKYGLEKIKTIGDAYMIAGGINDSGIPYTEAIADMALAMRDLARHLRETGESAGYNASFIRAARSRFLQAMEDAVQAIQRAG